ncbi:hypothetical protein ZIOFF_050400 [Zingiber officinale]|uniref:Uncharacterized protein n=1 Tax=Zingiber officinale TaxID=94328 RepID=A0A8J5FR12_ZINOF|nr:hypothetical protein ZIOFF_050400 [Zingiber officinale]
MSQLPQNFLLLNWAMSAAIGSVFFNQINQRLKGGKAYLGMTPSTLKMEGLLPLAYRAIIRYKKSRQSPDVGRLVSTNKLSAPYARLAAGDSSQTLSSDSNFPSPRALPNSAAP